MKCPRCAASFDSDAVYDLMDTARGVVWCPMCRHRFLFKEADMRCDECSRRGFVFCYQNNAWKPLRMEAPTPSQRYEMADRKRKSKTRNKVLAYVKTAPYEEVERIYNRFVKYREEPKEGDDEDE